ncbi:hypothetical protein Plhal304r1_c002g0006781 [Plasmopara halstedii]
MSCKEGRESSYLTSQQITLAPIEQQFHDLFLSCCNDLILQPAHDFFTHGACVSIRREFGLNYLLATVLAAPHVTRLSK